MKFLDAASLRDRLQPAALIEALRQGLGSDAIQAPLRHAHVMRATAEGQDSLLLMPAWEANRALGVKLVTVMTADAGPASSTVNALYILFDAENGAPVACLDGEALTLSRTAAQSALAASILARQDASRLLMVGTGRLSQAMVVAHAAARPLSKIALWGRNPARASERAGALHAVGIQVEVAGDLEAAVASVDIVCCATTAREPVILGRWLRQGQHLDLVGGFRPDMREADDEALLRARVFVDTHAGCLAEAGDLTQPIATGRFRGEDVVADIADLCSGQHAGRANDEEITLFKSVGTARADLVAARLANGDRNAVA